MRGEGYKSKYLACMRRHKKEAEIMLIKGAPKTGKNAKGIARKHRWKTGEKCNKREHYYKDGHCLVRKSQYANERLHHIRDKKARGYLYWNPKTRLYLNPEFGKSDHDMNAMP